LPEGHLIQTLSYLTPEQSPRIPSMKNTIVDVKCTDETGRIFIVEMQMTWSQSFLKRFLFETSKAYVQQLDRGKTYNTLCPVYGLALVNQTFESTTDDWFHHYKITNVKDMDRTLEGMEMVLLEVPKFNPKTLKHRRVGVLWMRFLREAMNLEAIPEEFNESPEVVKAMELAQESAYTPDELADYDEYLDAVRVGQTVRADSLKEGEEKGRKEGREEGREEERKKNLEEKKDMVRKMLQMGMSIKDVHNVTNLPEDIVTPSLFKPLNVPPPLFSWA
jgi:predicted transposase/invertase (TIGR01784 family)